MTQSKQVSIKAQLVISASLIVLMVLYFYLFGHPLFSQSKGLITDGGAIQEIIAFFRAN